MKEKNILKDKQFQRSNLKGKIKQKKRKREKAKSTMSDS